jgi:hypothetical protein
MNETAHFARFKRKHRMLVAHKHEVLTAPNGHRTNKELHVSLHLPDRLPWKLWLRDEFRRTLIGKEWEHVVVNKHVDAVTMPKWIASAILVAVLAFIVQSWWARSADHDAMIRIATALEMAEKRKIADDAEQKRLDGDMQAWRETMNGTLREIKGMLTQQQINALERLNNKKLNQGTEN